MKALFLVLIWGWHGYAHAQSVQGLLVKGHIANSTTRFLFVNSGKELTKYITDRIVVDSFGNFETWFPKRNVSGYLHLTNGNGFDLNLYTDEADSITLKWSDRNPPATLSIQFENKKPDKMLANWFQQINELRKKKEHELDTCLTPKSYFNVIRKLHQEENSLLKKSYVPIASVQYKRLATDLFYHNLNLILSSPYFNDLDFSGLKQPIFPPIVLQDEHYEQILASSYLRLKKENPEVSDAILQSLSSSEVKNAVSANFAFIDTVAFHTSLEYRHFITDYFRALAQDMSNRKLGDHLTVDVIKYAEWLKTLVANKEIRNFLISNMIEDKILTNKLINLVELDHALNLIDNLSIKEELITELKRQTTINKGDKAPDFKYVSLDGKISSLSKLSGKYVFITFWESACAPCIADIVGFSKTAARKYVDKNVVFLYISLDSENQTWLKTVKAIAARGINGRIKEGWNGAATKDYAIFAIPRHIIVNPDGTIMDFQAPLLREIVTKDPFTGL